MNKHSNKNLLGRSKRARVLLVALLAVVYCGLELLAGSAAHGAYYHDLEKNRQPCSDCHILHYSAEGGKPAGVEAGGPFKQLLISATTNKLCLFCHDGSDPKAPDALDPVSMYSGSGDEHSGAGFFDNSGGFRNRYGHDLGFNAVTVPFSSLNNVILNCASCHDPHGTPNYRNLLSSPAAGPGVALVMGAEVFRESPPGDPPSLGASIAAYKESNLGYEANSSLWCTECHDELKPTFNTPSNRKHHFIDVPINGVGYPTDPTHWAGGVGSGFGVVTGDGIEGVPRLRFQVSGAVDYLSASTVAANNQIICISCHLGHGGNHVRGLTWPFKDSGNPVDKDSGCQQCHNY